MFSNGHVGNKHQRFQKNICEKTLTIINLTIVLYNIFLGVVWIRRYDLWDIYPSLWKPQLIILWKQLGNDSSKTGVDTNSFIARLVSEIFQGEKSLEATLSSTNNYIILSPCGNLYSLGAWLCMFLKVQNVNITNKPVWGSLEEAYTSLLSIWVSVTTKFIRSSFFIL